jgi:TatA/E family protein of Tat protein translocase
MNFFNIGPTELLFILVLALIIFGPGKLPEVAKGLGKAVSDFRRASQGLTQDLAKELTTAPTQEDKAEKAAGPPAGATTPPRPQPTEAVAAPEPRPPESTAPAEPEPQRAVTEPPTPPASGEGSQPTVTSSAG